MKCKVCNEKKGSTRCEGCDILLCLPCINKHQNELMQQFQQLMDIRNELKQSLETREATSQPEGELPCFIEVDRWERENIERIREIANKVRTDIEQIMVKNVMDIRYQLEQLSASMQQQQKEENYLENDLERVKLQLNQLKETIRHVNENIHVTTSTNVDWNTLIHVMTDKDFIRNKFQTDQEKQLDIKSASSHRSYKQSIFRPATPVFEWNGSGCFRPISPPVFPQTDSSGSERNSPTDRAISLEPTPGETFSWITVAKNRQNT